MASALVNNGAMAAWGSTVKCGKSGYQVSGRRLDGDLWGPIYRVARACAKYVTSYSSPLISAEGNNAATVWAETSTRTRGGIFIAYGRAGQAKLKRKRLVKFSSKAVISPSFGILLRRGRLWLAWQDPLRDLRSKNGSFKVQAFSASSGKALTDQLKIVGVGKKWANRNTPGTFLFQPTSSGLLLMWRLTDAGGQTMWYGATGDFNLNQAGLVRQLSMRARGPISVTKNMHFGVSSNGNLYRLEEQNPGTANCIAGSPVTFVLTQWDSTSAQWQTTAGENITTSCLTRDPLFVDFLVSSDGSLRLVTKLPPANVADCRVSDRLGQHDCQRFVAPVSSGSIGKVFNRGSGAIDTKSLTVPTSWLPATGKSVAWMAPDQGLTQLMANNRLLWLGGLQKVTSEGAVTQSDYQAVISPSN